MIQDLFVCYIGLTSHSTTFHYCIWRCRHYRWGALNLTFARHSWPLSSEGFIAWHSECDTGHPFIIVISEDPLYSRIAERLSVDLSLPVFSTSVCRGWDSNTQLSACEVNAITNCVTAAFTVSGKVIPAQGTKTEQRLTICSPSTVMATSSY